jgi:hypothetical protein
MRVKIGPKGERDPELMAISESRQSSSSSSGVV